MVATDYKRRVRRVSRHLTRKREERGGETLTAPEQRARARAVIKKRDASASEKPKGGGKGGGDKKPDNQKHVNVTEASARRTEGTVAKSAVKTKVAARIKADKPSLTGKARATRIEKQTTASVARKEGRGMTVTGKGKKKK